MKSQSKRNSMVLFIGQTEELNVMALNRLSQNCSRAGKSTQKGKREQKKSYVISKLSRLVVRETVFNRGVSSNYNERGIKVTMTMHASRARHATLSSRNY